MAKVTRIDKVVMESKKRVAAYCRVSTNHLEQLDSLEAQKSHYEQFIKQNPEWEFAGVYYDEGISGTKKEKRDGLMAMVHDCEIGLIDLVLTKSVSRFCRNTTDCLELVRQLTNYGTAIIFESENINTGSMDGELVLAVLAGLADGESRSISGNGKWSIRQRFLNGTFVIPIPPYGYVNVNGEMKIVPEEAEVVQRIFADFLDGKSAHDIADALNKQGIGNRKGSQWKKGTIASMLRNEKYTGDVMFQKYYMDEQFHHRVNRGERDMYYCPDHHEAIISHETFDKAKALIEQHKAEKGNTGDTEKYGRVYSMTGRIICGECGKTFRRRIHGKPSGKYKYIAWACVGHLADKTSCSMKFIKDEDIKRALVVMFNKLRFGRGRILKPLLAAIKECQLKDNSGELAEIAVDLQDNDLKRVQLKELLSNGYIEKPVFIEADNKLAMDSYSLLDKRNRLLQMSENGHSVVHDIKDLLEYLNGANLLEEYSGELFNRFIAKVTVVDRKTFSFEFNFGLQLTERVV